MKKKICKVILMVLAISMLVTCSGYAFADLAASDEVSTNFQVYHYEISEEKHTSEMVSEINSGLFYTYSDENLSYCAQIAPGGKIQFSYYLVGKNVLMESEVYEMDSLYKSYSIERSLDNNYLQLNRKIIKNIESFSKVRIITDKNVPEEMSDTSVRASSINNNLDDAIEELFGADYTGVFNGLSNKTHEGTTYTVRCTESQTTSYDTPDSMWFAKEVAFSTVVAWALGGGWNWVGVVLSIIGTAVDTVVLDGVTRTANAFTAERTNVTIMRTRIVTVNGYTGTHYWSGWTRKVYFFKGDYGWVHDFGNNWEQKYYDYDDVSGLMATGWQNFLNTVLM